MIARTSWVMFRQVVGIIDYMRQYDIIKRVERMGKSVTMIAGQAAPTIIQPSNYKDRFKKVRKGSICLAFPYEIKTSITSSTVAVFRTSCSANVQESEFSNFSN